MADIKVEKALWKRTVEGIGAIRCWCGHRKFEMNCTVERGDTPKLLIKRTNREKTGEPEVEVVFLGPHRDEDHTYYKKDPATWRTFGNIVVTPTKAREVGQVLSEAGSPTLLDFKPRIISLVDIARVARCENLKQVTGHGRGKRRRKRE
jgi:hypothetical protein